jgi:hypothetical protein
VDVISQLLSGFGAALTPTNLLMAFLGALLGTLVGVSEVRSPAGRADTSFRWEKAVQKSVRHLYPVS